MAELSIVGLEYGDGKRILFSRIAVRDSVLRITGTGIVRHGVYTGVKQSSGSIYLTGDNMPLAEGERADLELSSGSGNHEYVPGRAVRAMPEANYGYLKLQANDLQIIGSQREEKIRRGDQAFLESL